MLIAAFWHSVDAYTCCCLRLVCCWLEHMTSAFITTWKKNGMCENDCGILIFLFVTSYSTMFSWVFKCFQYEGLSIYKGKNEVFTCIQWKLGSFVVLELNFVNLAVYLLGFIGNCMFSTLLWKCFCGELFSCFHCHVNFSLIVDENWQKKAPQLIMQTAFCCFQNANIKIEHVSIECEIWILMAVTFKLFILWDVTSHSLAKVYLYFRGMYCKLFYPEAEIAHSFNILARDYIPLHRRKY